MNAVPEPHPGSSLSHGEVLRILSGVLLGLFLAALDQMIVATALPTLAAELSGVEHLSWIVSIYLLTSTASTPLYGKLSDLYGRRIMLETAIAIFILGSALCTISQTMGQLIAARALQGLGGGGLITLAHAVIADIVSPRERGRYQAYLSAAWATASVGGPMLGGAFVDYLSWRWVFGINLPIGAAAFLLCRRALRHLPRRFEQRPIDYLGALLLTSGVTALLLVSTWGGSQYAWDSAPILSLCGAGLVLLMAFVLQEFRAVEPILPPRLFRNDVFRAANGASFVISMMMFGSTMLLPIFLQLVQGVSAGRSGALIAPMTGGSVLGAFASGQVMRYTGRYRITPLIGMPVAAAAFFLLSTMSTRTPALLTAVYMAMLGIGMGVTLPVMLVATQNAADSRDIGAASSAVNFFRSLGGSFGAAILWSVLIIAFGHETAGPSAAASAGGFDFLHGGPENLSRLSPELRAAVVPALAHAFRAVFLTGACLAAVSFVIALFLREIPLRTTPATPPPAARPAIQAKPEKSPAD